MTPQELKNSILQRAIQGKLVPQDPKEGSGEELLRAVRAEKERLVKEGKIKKEKKLPEITDDEKPFEIPDNWVWVRLGDLCNIINGFTPLRTNSEFWNDPSVPWFTVDDIHTQGRRIKKTRQAINVKALASNTERILPSNTVLLCCTASVGEYALTEIPLTTNQQFNGLVIKEEFEKYCSAEYLFQIAPTFKAMLLKIAGKTTFNFISVKKVSMLLIPLPPLAEQQRIVSKLESLQPFVESYTRSWNRLEELSNRFPGELRKSLLQRAIEGRLVARDPSEGTGADLLREIQLEKRRLVEEGKIKKEKPLPEITDDEKPFEIPDNWVWVRLGSICTKIVDGDHNPPKGEINPTPYIMASSLNINNDRLVNLERVRYLSLEQFAIADERTKARMGDVLLTTVGSLGRSCIYKGELNICFQRSVSVITACIFNKYLKAYFDSEEFQNVISREAKGTAQRGYYLNQLYETLIPLPPLAEQRRIVSKLSELLPLCDRLTPTRR